MNAIGIAVAAVNVLLLLVLPRRLALLPLLLAASYMVREQDFEIASAHFSVLRLLVLFGALRVLMRGEGLKGGLHVLDKTVLLWAACFMATSAFHRPDAFMYRAGIVWSDLGCYFLFRCWMPDASDVERMCRYACLLMVPLAVLMLYEKFTGYNLFGALFDQSSDAVMRNDQFRARGAFAGPILAGTAAATILPLAVFVWYRGQRALALTGALASATVVYSTTSSGPVVTLLTMIFGLALWRFRRFLGPLRWAALAAIVALQMVMNDPVYFLMARIDLAGGSQGWFRAQLIRSSIDHLDEWWAFGTDFTRHWMATGNYATAEHTDITNHFLAMGIMGGLPLMLLFCLILVSAFRLVGRVLAEEDADFHRSFLAWSLGAALFGHVLNFMSISLFDQSAVFLYLILAAMGSMVHRPVAQEAEMPPEPSRPGPSRTLRSATSAGIGRPAPATRGWPQPVSHR